MYEYHMSLRYSYEYLTYLLLPFLPYHILLQIKDNNEKYILKYLAFSTSLPTIYPYNLSIFLTFLYT